MHTTSPRFPKLRRTVAAVALPLLLSIAACITFAPTARAGTDVDLRAGIYTDPDALALGAGLLTSISGYSGWYFNPNVELAVPDGGSELSLNADVHYDFPVRGSVSPYLGFGPSLVRISPDHGDSHTDVGMNLIGGLSGLRGPTRPFVQFKARFADGSDLALMGGVRF